VTKPPTKLKVSELFQQDTDARVAKIRLDIGRRLRKACNHLSEEEFATLVEGMMRVQLAGENRLR